MQHCLLVFVSSCVYLFNLHQCISFLAASSLSNSFDAFAFVLFVDFIHETRHRLQFISPTSTYYSKYTLTPLAFAKQTIESFVVFVEAVCGSAHQACLST